MVKWPTTWNYLKPNQKDTKMLKMRVSVFLTHPVILGLGYEFPQCMYSIFYICNMANKNINNSELESKIDSIFFWAKFV